MVYGVLCDSVLLSKLEADFRQYYHFSIRELYDLSSPVTLREIYNLTAELPDTSRFMKHIGNDLFSIDQHLQANNNDILKDLTYQVSLLLMSNIGAKEFKKAMQNAPEPMERPTAKPKEKPKPKFLTGRELAVLPQINKH